MSFREEKHHKSCVERGGTFFLQKSCERGGDQRGRGQDRKHTMCSVCMVCVLRCDVCACAVWLMVCVACVCVHACVVHDVYHMCVLRCMYGVCGVCVVCVCVHTCMVCDVCVYFVVSVCIYVCRFGECAPPWKMYLGKKIIDELTFHEMEIWGKEGTKGI